MTERERILRTYRHQEVDRIPMIDTVWASWRSTSVSLQNMKEISELARKLGKYQ